MERNQVGLNDVRGANTKLLLIETIHDWIRHEVPTCYGVVDKKLRSVTLMQNISRK